MAEVDNETLACTYAALILHDDGLPINAESMTKLFKAANCEVETFWPGMFAKALAGADINALCMKLGDAGAGGGDAGGDAPAAAAGGGGGGGDKKEAKKKEPEPEEEEDMGFSLFD